MKPNFRHHAPRPVGLAFRGEHLQIMLANGRLYCTPLSLYYWLQTADEDDMHLVEFRRYGIWWPTLENGIYIEELLIAPTTQVEAASWQTCLKRRLIIFLEDLEAGIVRHRLPGLCTALAFSPLWGEDWLELP